MISQEIFSCIIFVRFMPQHQPLGRIQTRHIESRLHVKFSKVNILVWTRLVKRADLSVSTSRWSGDRTTFLIGRIRLSVSTVNRTYELSGITHVTLFPKYGKHSTGPSTYGPWVRTYSKSFSCKPVLTVCSYRAQSNEIFTYGEVSRGSVPRVRRYGLLYLRAVEYDQCLRNNNWVARGRHKLDHFTAQTPLRMQRTPPDVTLAGAWSKLKHHRDCCHYIGHSWYTGLHH